MKLPRDVNGIALARSLTVFGYEVTRQTGSHIRLTTTENGEHHITIPAHDPIKIGTLSNILKDIADHHQISRSDVLARLRI
jgi:predicted RNA binding protein YcfA (HicA-like mRNA interferase family)